MAIKTEILAVSPQLAEEMLGHNINNRAVKRRMVTTYAADMTAGRWKLTGAGIVLADDGALLDGQHRLLAVIDSGVTTEFLIVHGVDKDSQPTIDTGGKRTFADVLTMRGEANATTLGAITKLVGMWDPDLGLPSGGVAPPSHSELLEVLAAHPELRDIAQRTSSKKNHLRGVRPAAFGLVVWLTERIDVDDALDFAEKYTTGVGLTEGSPILALRRYCDGLYLVGGKPASATVGLDTRYWVAILIKAWNAFRDGREVKAVLTWKRGGAKPEPFPLPR